MKKKKEKARNIKISLLGRLELMMADGKKEDLIPIEDSFLSVSAHSMF